MILNRLAMINNSSSTSDAELYKFKKKKMKDEIKEKHLTPVFGKKNTCFGILSIIKQTLTNVLLVGLSSFNNGVLPKRKSLPKKNKDGFFSSESLSFFFYQVEQWNLHKHQTKKILNVHLYLYFHFDQFLLRVMYEMFELI